MTKLDKLAIGGGMANTFLYAQGHDVGGSLLREGPGRNARGRSVWQAQNNGCKLFLPLDIVVAGEDRARRGQRVYACLRRWAPSTTDERILDAGPETVERLCRAISQQSKTLIWNGPLGVFEMPPFDKGNRSEAAHHAMRPGWPRRASWWQWPVAVIRSRP